MLTTTQPQSGSIKVVDCRCITGPAEKPLAEMHVGYCIAYVRQRSFGYMSRGVTDELLAGSVLLPGGSGHLAHCRPNEPQSSLGINVH